MHIDIKEINQNKIIVETRTPFEALQNPEVVVERSFFKEISNCSCIIITDWSCFLRINSCFFEAIINPSGRVIDFHNENQDSQYLFSHCSSNDCHSRSNGFYSHLNSLSISRNELTLCSFANIKSRQGLIRPINGKVRISDLNMTHTINEYDAIFLDSNQELLLSFCHLSDNVVSGWGLFTIDSGPSSIYSCNFLDVEEINSALNLWRGTLMLISLSNFVGVKKNKTFFVNSQVQDAHIILAGCYLQGESIETEKVVVIDKKINSVAEPPHSFLPVYVIVCSQKSKSKGSTILLVLLVNLVKTSKS